MLNISVMLVTSDYTYFQRVRGLLHGRNEARFFPERVDEYRPLVAVRRERPDVLIVDSFCLGELALRTVRRIAALQLPTRTLLVHTSWTEAGIAHVLQCGGAGCLARQASAAELLRAICAVRRGELWASRKVVADTLHLLRVPAVPDPDQQTLSGLSKRELEIVEWMRKGMTNKEIARAWHQRHDGQDACAEHLP